MKISYDHSISEIWLKSALSENQWLEVFKTNTIIAVIYVEVPILDRYKVLMISKIINDLFKLSEIWVQLAKLEYKITNLDLYKAWHLNNYRCMRKYRAGLKNLVCFNSPVYQTVMCIDCSQMFKHCSSCIRDVFQSSIENCDLCNMNIALSRVCFNQAADNEIPIKPVYHNCSVCKKKGCTFHYKKINNEIRCAECMIPKTNNDKLSVISGEPPKKTRKIIIVNK